VFILARCYTFIVVRITNNALEEMTVINGFLRVSSKLGCILLKVFKRKIFEGSLMINYHNFVITKFNNFISNPIMMMHLGNPLDLILLRFSLRYVFCCAYFFRYTKKTLPRIW